MLTFIMLGNYWFAFLTHMLYSIIIILYYIFYNSYSIQIIVHMNCIWRSMHCSYYVYMLIVLYSHTSVGALRKYKFQCFKVSSTFNFIWKCFYLRFLRIMLSPRYWEFCPMKLGKKVSFTLGMGPIFVPKNVNGKSLQVL